MPVPFRSFLIRFRRQVAKRRRQEAIEKENSRAPTLTECEYGCKICVKLYNEVNRLPMVFTCGHTVCLECASRIWLRAKAFKCPFCRSCAHGVEVNQQMIELLENVSEQFGVALLDTGSLSGSAEDLRQSMSACSDDYPTASDSQEQAIPPSMVQLVEEFSKIARSSRLPSVSFRF
ncbi:E3 ubiquitin-protein ligase TRIM23 [Aphelenchoides avenae]|nr:E3 ubiquitin-protein ligase TRIM23 [Aphelenchus avenae]